MRHSVHIMFGKHFAQTIQELKKYMLKYGESEHLPYFNAIFFEQSSEGSVSLSRVELTSQDPDVFISGLNELYSVELVNKVDFSSDEKEDSVKQYFDDLWASSITMGNKGDYSELHICLYIPLFEPELWKQAQTLIDWIKSLNRQTHIDLIGFDTDMAGIMFAEETDDITAKNKKEREKLTKEVVLDIVKYRKSNQNNIFHFLIMQNRQTGGISLNLDYDAFIRVVGEFALMCIEHYQSLFDIAPPDSDLQAFGISVLHFDKYYFVEYLLRKTYLEAMTREGVQQEEVDINKAFNKSKDLLEKRINTFSTFFKEEVLKRFDAKEPENQIVADVVPLLKAKLNELERECDSFISDKRISIPAKRAILAALLGYDDNLFVNTIYDEHTPIFDDLDRETITLFVNANNALLYTESPSNALLSKSYEPVRYPLTEMKALHSEMQKRVGYIRQLEEEKSRLESQIENISESKKCLIQNGFFIFGDTEYRLLPNVIEEPLKENYVAHKVDVQSLDLRGNFNNVKNQGKQGACLAFSLTSIYEYILKSNNAKEVDLSEAFVYYNARKKAGKETVDAGCSLHCAIDSLAESGICLEKSWEYNEDVFDVKPNEDAYADGLTRRVKKALNVNGQIEDLKSALSDGYPVVISVNLFPSFGENQLGFIPIPSEDERKNVDSETNQCHAMVVTGFDDEKKFFVVRNSWGKNFGDDGYCYLPYSYVLDSKLFHWACVITEVDVYSVNPKKVKTALKFDETNTDIRLAIVSNLLYEEQVLLKRNEVDYQGLRSSYEFLKQSLKNPNTQTKLRQYTQERILEEKTKLEERREQVTKEKYEELDRFDDRTRKMGIKISLFAIGILLLVFLFSYLGFWKFVANIFEEEAVQSVKWKYILSSILLSSVLVGCMFLYFPYRKKKRKNVEQEYDDILEDCAVQISRKDKELAETNLKMHVAGYYLSNLFVLQSSIISKYYSTVSFLNNLKIWYSEEEEMLDNWNVSTKPPFIPMLKNDVLDHFFEKQKDGIVANISLCSSIVGFSAKIQDNTICKEDLVHFQNEIKQNCVGQLFSIIKKFNVYSYLCDKAVKYDFLEQDRTFIDKILEELDEKSKIFLCDNGTDSFSPKKLILIHSPSDADTRQWEKFYPRFFTEQPVGVLSLSPNKVMVVQLADLTVKQLL